jgi:flagellar motor switch protein FliN
MESMQGKAFTGAPRPPQEADAISAEGAVWPTFKVTGRLGGDQCFQLKRSDAVRLGQLLMSEPLDGNAELTDNLNDALSELFRQFAGVVATNCKPKYGGEVVFNLESSKKPEWIAAEKSAWTFTAPDLEPIHWNLLLSVEFKKSLEDAKAEKAEREKQEGAAQAAAEVPAANAEASAAPPPAQKEPSKGAARAAPPGTAARPGAAGAGGVASGTAEGVEPPANLDLLLDVELKASLRFGQKEMLLREILELRPGSVIELDKQVQEPAELLVAGRVIAWGDVVIVDGNYGLRVTDIAQPHQRLEAVET